ncbi:MAG: ABC transporter substrate-binding protein, partial [Bacteroidetes bacterium]|nr:ABC transporter substrate-binding protein [Bacteroidota bacterium]
MILIFGIYISCSGPERDNKGKTVFRYNEAAGITSLDPAFAKNLANIWACNQLFNGLVQLDNNLKVIPCIANEWKISGDGLTYTFHLRNDIYFHDHPLFNDQKGRKVVAGDFVYSFNRILDPVVASPGAWVFQNVELRDRQYGFFAPDDSTVIIRLAKPFPPFLGILSMQYCSVIPREVVEYYGKDFRQNPVGTGPFYFKMWKEGVKLVCRRNNHYFEKDLMGNPLPYLEAVSITFLMDKQSAFLEFVKGNLDFMSGLDASYKDELLTKDGKLHPKYQDKFQLITEPYLNTEYLGILVDTGSELVRKSPLRFRSVRKAINYGFDREKMIRYLRNNIGIPGNYGIVPSGMPSFDSNFVRGYSYNPDKARHLLASAGFQNGNNLPDITLATTSEYL